MPGFLPKRFLFSCGFHPAKMGLLSPGTCGPASPDVPLSVTGVLNLAVISRPPLSIHIQNSDSQCIIGKPNPVMLKHKLSCGHDYAIRRLLRLYRTRKVLVWSISAPLAGVAFVLTACGLVLLDEFRYPLAGVHLKRYRIVAGLTSCQVMVDVCPNFAP